MKIKITALFMLFMATSIAQNYNFGKVSTEELEEQFYPLDSTVGAAYLHKARKTYYDFTKSDGFIVITEYQERIKIYTKEGFNKATKVICYYNPDNGNTEEVQSIKAYTFNLEKGKVKKTRLSNKAIFGEKKSKFYSLKKFTMPDVKLGTVIELRYRVRSPYPSSLKEVQFQYDLPVKNLEATIELPEFFNFRKLNKGFYRVTPKVTHAKRSIYFRTDAKMYGGSGGSRTSGATYKVKFQAEVSKYKAKNIPALKNDEPFVSDISNYRGGVIFELAATNFMSLGGGIEHFSTTWEDVSKEIYTMKGFGDELEKSNYFKDDLAEILTNLKEDSQKVNAIFQFVKSKVKWNKYYGKTTDNGVRKAYKEGSGNVADLNLMLTAMLRASGLTANPVLISTRNNGIPLFPTLNGFNYVIAMVEFANGTSVLLDATEPYSLPDILPVRDLNWNGRKVTKEGKSSWVSLKSDKPALEENFVYVKIKDNYLAEGMIRTSFKNLKAINYRINNNHLKDEIVISNLETTYGITIDNFKQLNETNIYKPISRIAQFTSEDLVENISGKLYITPLLFLATTNNPFKLEERKFPVDFGTPRQEINNVSIEIPKGYKVAFLPEQMAIAMPEKLGVFKYQVKEDGNKIAVTSILTFNNALVGNEYYPILKKFYGTMVAKQTEKIVFVSE